MQRVQCQVLCTTEYKRIIRSLLERLPGSLGWRLASDGSVCYRVHNDTGKATGPPSVVGVTAGSTCGSSRVCQQQPDQFGPGGSRAGQSRWSTRAITCDRVAYVGSLLVAEFEFAFVDHALQIGSSFAARLRASQIRLVESHALQPANGGCGAGGRTASIRGQRSDRPGCAVHTHHGWLRLTNPRPTSELCGSATGPP
jgi:hypothetical protein